MDEKLELQDELSKIEIKEEVRRKNQLIYNRYQKLLTYKNWVSVPCAILILGGLHFLAFKLFSKYDSFPGLWVFALLWTFIIIESLWEIMEAAYICFVRYYLSISKQNIKNEEGKRYEFYKKKRVLESQINEINKQRENQNWLQKERDYIEKLNKVVQQAKTSNLSPEELQDYIINLSNENEILRRNGYKVFKAKYYELKFNDLDKALINSKLLNGADMSGQVLSRNDNSLDKRPINEFTKSSSEQPEINPNSNQYPEIEEIELSEILNLRSKKNTPERKKNDVVNEGVQPKIDFLELNSKKKIIGDKGELFALQWEKDKLLKKGLKFLADKVEHISLTNDSKGYDILSFCENGDFKYIEVKTTTSDSSNSFFISETENEALNNLPNYYIYRVFDFNEITESGKIFTINCSNQFNEFYSLQPISFRVTLK